MADKYAWKNFGNDVERAQKAIKAYQYPGMFEAPLYANSIQYIWDLPSVGLALGQVKTILSESALAPPHGLDLLTPVTPRELPKLPTMPSKASMESYHEWRVKEFEKLKANIETVRTATAAKMRQEEKEGNEIADACKADNSTAIKKLMLTTLVRHPLPELLSLEADFVLDVDSRIALCTISTPDLAKLPIVKKRGSSARAKWTGISATERKKVPQTLLRALCIRAGYLIAMSDPDNLFDTVAINAHQKWFDPATGAPQEGIVASLQALKQDLCQLNPGHLDPDACFRHLAGISTPNILNATPVRPIFVMDTNDKRIVADKDVASELQEETNLAAMPWEDFEHLVRQLFEWMFTFEGVEVRVTRASRDRGVDAIIFDPDPIRGGIYVVQAKRYTRTVEVAAVRDLYGTVVNEGANRGILVTTSTYGPDSYEFAKNKPISLIDGANLLVLLKKHGRIYRIDLEEARLLESSP